MQNSKNILITFVVMFVLLVSCTGQSRRLDTTVSTTPSSVEGGFPMEATQFAQQAKATANSQATYYVLQTQTFQTQSALDLLSAGSATAEAFSQATMQSGPMLQRVEELRTHNLLTSTTGTYVQLSDLDASWALRDHYDTLLSEYVVSDFVLSSVVEWASTGKNVDASNAGCGFVFRLNARGDHYLIYLASDGWAYLYLALDHHLSKVGRGQFSEVPLDSGTAVFLLAAQTDRFTLLVNDTQIFQVKDGSLESGFLGQAIASGTNTDPGTHCRMTKTELWRLDAP